MAPLVMASSFNFDSSWPDGQPSGLGSVNSYPVVGDWIFFPAYLYGTTTKYNVATGRVEAVVNADTGQNIGGNHVGATAVGDWVYFGGLRTTTIRYNATNGQVETLADAVTGNNISRYRAGAVYYDGWIYMPSSRNNYAIERYHVEDQIIEAIAGTEGNYNGACVYGDRVYFAGKSSDTIYFDTNTGEVRTLADNQGNILGDRFSDITVHNGWIYLVSSYAKAVRFNVTTGESQDIDLGLGMMGVAALGDWVYFAGSAANTSKRYNAVTGVIEELSGVGVGRSGVVAVGDFVYFGSESDIQPAARYNTLTGDSEILHDSVDPGSSLLLGNSCVLI